jgi:hypothetical protein
MAVDLSAAVSFMATHGRVLDRRRLRLLLGNGDPGAVLSAVDAYRNPDGGYGWGLEPDLRAAESQPAAALHAFEVFEDVAPATTPRAVQLCDWLAAVTLADGGLPFALPVTDVAGLAPFWAQADPTVSSIQITAYVAAVANRVAVHDPAVAGHSWLGGATRYCLTRIGEMNEDSHALELVAALWLLDAVHDTHPEVGDLLDRLGRLLPASGCLHVAGGTEEEMVRPLDFAPYSGRPVRKIFRPDAVSADLQRLVNDQQDDGGWRVDFASYSPAAALEWRGYQTVRAVSILRRNTAGGT